MKVQSATFFYFSLVAEKFMNLKLKYGDYFLRVILDQGSLYFVT